MRRNLSKLVPVFLLSLIPTFLIWLPFFFRMTSLWGIPLPQQGMATIVSNYDGPLYLVVAKTFYNPEAIKANFQFPLPTEYYTAHFPLFPALIKLFSFVLGYPYSMLLVTLGTSILAIYFFYKLIRKYAKGNEALFLTFVFSVFPARWLIVRSVGSAEPLFIAAIIASLYFFKRKKYLLAGIWGLVAQVTKSPGIILFISYFAFLVFTKYKSDILKLLKRAYPIFFAPLSLLLVFSLYKITTGDFFAYFHSGDNIHLFFPPFQIFNYSASWVGTFWLEEIIFIYLLGSIAVYKLFEKKEYEIAVFSLIFFISTIFVSHRDLIRYSLPLVPFALIAFSDTLIKKEFKIAMAVIILPIYLFSLAFISQNAMPVSNWAPFL
ncbi:hypothetical protein ACFL1Q_01520 [Patescibacteria group bacterium]